VRRHARARGRLAGATAVVARRRDLGHPVEVVGTSLHT
jgi:hypothetical protein